MKAKLKRFVSESGLWAAYDEFEWKKVHSRMVLDKVQTPEEWRERYFHEKKGDTFFVLGSGYSVNDVSDSQWDYVRQQFSIGFNNWFFHPFIPDVYGFEQSKNQEFCKAQIEAFNKVDPALFEIPLFVHTAGMSGKGTSDFDYPWADSKIYKNLPLSLHTINRKILETYIKRSVSSKNLVRLLHYSASVAMYIDLGIRLGYKKIVLVGFDMDDPRYFYEKDQYAELAGPVLKILEEYHKNTGRNKVVHASADAKITETYGCLPVDEYIYLLNDTLKAIDSEYEISVNSPKSRLAKKLEVFTDWD